MEKLCSACLRKHLKLIPSDFPATICSLIAIRSSSSQLSCPACSRNVCSRFSSSCIQDRNAFTTPLFAQQSSPPLGFFLHESQSSVSCELSILSIVSLAAV